MVSQDSLGVGVIKSAKNKTGWQVKLVFSIELHNKDIDLLNQIKAFYGVGSIWVQNKEKQTAIFTVGSIEDLTNVIIPHFVNYPLLTQKRPDFELFKQVSDLVNNKEHLTEEGLRKIVSFRASINKGLPT